MKIKIKSNQSIKVNQQMPNRRAENRTEQNLKLNVKLTQENLVENHIAIDRRMINRVNNHQLGYNIESLWREKEQHEQ